MKLVGVVGFLVAGSAALFAQTETDPSTPRKLVNSDTTTVQRKLQPGMLTSGEKGAMVWRNLTSTRTLINRLTWAGINQVRDRPDEWDQDLGGYGQRLAMRYGRTVVRGSIMLGLDVAFKTDSRYDRCDCEGFGARTGHAWKRVLFSRKDYGGEMISPAKIAGAYGTPLIMNNFYPDRLNTPQRALTNGSTYLAWRGATNMLREFWPDIRRSVFRRKD